MPLDDGQAITDLFEKVYDTGQRCFHLNRLTFEDFVKAAEARATRDKVAYRDATCRSEYGPSNPEIIACSFQSCSASMPGVCSRIKPTRGITTPRRPPPCTQKWLRTFVESWKHS